MTNIALNPAAEPPLWLTQEAPTTAQKYQAALRWTTPGDSRFTIRADHLASLLDSGFQATPRYSYRVLGLPGGDTEFTQWCKKLGQGVQARIAETASAETATELEPFAHDVGDVTNWTYGFKTLFTYLDEIVDRTEISLDGLSIEGMPGRALMSAARGLNGTTSTNATAVEPTATDTTADVVALLKDELNVIVEGVAGSGKSHLLGALRPFYAQVEVIVFHPSTSYEEFVSGLRPTRTQGGTGFEGVAGIFVLACQRAAADPENLHLLFIDEINRANTSRVFGDLMLPIEKTKRFPAANLSEGHALMSLAPPGATAVRLQTPVGEDLMDILVVPDNLHILGTMNSTDRSVGTIDLALRRRFAWVEMEPLSAALLQEDPDFVAKYSLDDSLKPDWVAVAEWYGETNEVLLEAIGPDARLGHAYIFGAHSPLAAARALSSQLAEIAFTFNVDPSVLENNPPIELNGAGLSLNAAYRGTGLGRRPSVITQQLSSSDNPPTDGTAP